MPMDLSRYPANWREISKRIRERSGGKCEWCGVENHTFYRNNSDGTRSMVDGMELEAAMLDGDKLTRIILTVAHLGTPHEDGAAGDKHDKMDVRDENLAALCQRCHLNYDRDEHVQNRRRNREKKENVQPLFEETT